MGSVRERDDNLKNPQGTQAPVMGGVRLGPTLVMSLYALLAASALLSFFGRRLPGAHPGAFPHVLEQVLPWVFLAFLVIFAFYRLGLVRAGKYPAFKAFFQIGLMLAVWLLLLPSSRIGFASGSDEGLDALLGDSNPRVRALAAEVARSRPVPERYAPGLARALEDSDARVREEAHQSLVRISGQDLGPAENPDAVRAWKERYP